MPRRTTHPACLHLTLMRNFLILARWCVIAWLGVAGAAHALQPLTTPAELKTLAEAGGVRIVDVRDAEAYALQHLPGAVSAP